ncbi:RIP metalloprotease RseP [bacterium]|nr:RIP metalloprotease RseP [bacterium]
MIVLEIIIFFGILIFIHELGHFLVAKAVGVRVEVFSLGFGPRLFGFKIGETDYRVSIIPLGGYVNMAGQFDVPDKESMERLTGQPWEFPSKPWWQRFMIASAGSLMNIFLAFFVFTFLVFFWGYPKYESTLKVGLLDPDMSEYAVLQKGDIIKHINDRAVKSWDELAQIIVESPDQTVTLEIERALETMTVTLSPKGIELEGSEKKRGRFGITPYLEARIGEVYEDQPAAKARLSLQSGDLIRAINDTPIEQWAEMRDIVAKNPLKPIQLTIVRNGPFELRVLSQNKSKDLNGCGLEIDAQKVVTAVKHQSNAYKAGILVGDRIVQVVEEQIPLWKRVLYRFRGHDVTTTLIVTLNRSEPFVSELIPIKNPLNGEGLIGISNYSKDAFKEIGREKIGLARSLQVGFQSTIFYSQLIFISIQKLVQREVTMDNLAGPVGITQMIGQQAKAGIKELLQFLAILSVNLGIINFFPIPVLDGGMMVVLLVEGIRRKPLSIRLQVVLQQIGFLILVPLILYVTYNDIVRILGKVLTP